MSNVQRITLSLEQYIERTFQMVEVDCARCDGEVLLHPPDDDVTVPWWCEQCTGDDRPTPVPLAQEEPAL